MSARSISAAEIHDHIRAQREEMTALLSELVLMESPSDVNQSQRPILDSLAAQFEQLGYRNWRIPGRNTGGHLYSRPKQRPRWVPCQLLLGHCDTVWPIGTLKSMPLECRDGILKGPGVYDMKAGLVEIIFALRALRALDLHPSVMPVVFINSDEEIGSRESTRYVRSLARLADRAMVLEPSLGRSGQIKTARKGVGRFTIKVKGKAAHAGLDPESGASAILELSHIIQKLFSLNQPEKGVTVNVGVIDGGVRANVVAPESSAVVDVRVETQRQADRIETAIHSLKAETPGVALSIEGRIGRPPMELTPRNRKFWKIASDLGEELGLDLTGAMAGGASDGNTTNQFTATLDGLGAVGGGAHAADEFVVLDELPERCALLTLLILTPPLNEGEAEIPSRLELSP